MFHKSVSQLFRCSVTITQLLIFCALTILLFLFITAFKESVSKLASQLFSCLILWSSGLWNPVVSKEPAFIFMYEMKASDIAETLVTTSKIIRCNSSEEHNLNFNCRDNLKSQIVKQFFF
jgi:uncharacterized membrane protein (DUF106 family)